LSTVTTSMLISCLVHVRDYIKIATDKDLAPICRYDLQQKRIVTIFFERMMTGQTEKDCFTVFGQSIHRIENLNSDVTHHQIFVCHFRLCIFVITLPVFVKEVNKVLLVCG